MFRMTVFLSILVDEKEEKHNSDTSIAMKKLEKLKITSDEETNNQEEHSFIKTTDGKSYEMELLGMCVLVLLNLNNKGLKKKKKVCKIYSILFANQSVLESQN